MVETPRENLRELLRLAIVANVLLVATIVSLYLEVVKRSLSYFIIFGVLAAMAAGTCGSLLWRLVGRVRGRHEREREFRESGKLILSYRDSIIGRFVVDGYLEATVSWFRFGLKCSLQWLGLILVILAIVSLVKLDPLAFLRVIPRATLICLGIGFFVGTLIELFGRLLQIVEGRRISLDVPATTTYGWAIDELARARISPDPSGYCAIELDFTNQDRRRPKGLRVISRLTDRDVDDLRKALSIDGDGPAE